MYEIIPVLSIFLIASGCACINTLCRHFTWPFFYFSRTYPSTQSTQVSLSHIYSPFYAQAHTLKQLTIPSVFFSFLAAPEEEDDENDELEDTETEEHRQLYAQLANMPTKKGKGMDEYFFMVEEAFMAENHPLPNTVQVAYEKWKKDQPGPPTKKLKKKWTTNWYLFRFLLE